MFIGDLPKTDFGLRARAPWRSSTARDIKVGGWEATPWASLNPRPKHWEEEREVEPFSVFRAEEWRFGEERAEEAVQF